MDTSKPIQLSLEQQFELRSFSDQVKQMNREQAKEALIYLYQEMMLKESAFKEMIAKAWGIAPPKL